MNINAYRPTVIDSIFNMGENIFRNYCGKEVNLVNTIKSCLRDDKLTLQGIEEERNKARKVLDITKTCDLGLLHIFIHKYGKELARLQRLKQLLPNAFEDVVMNFSRSIDAVNAKDKAKLKTEKVAARVIAVADTLRLFAESDIQFVKDDDFEDVDGFTSAISRLIGW